jgi:hypothetical protein
MAIGPSHRCLQNLMQTVQANVERDLDTAQNQRFDIVKGNLEAGDGVGGHAATLRCSACAAT